MSRIAVGLVIALTVALPAWAQVPFDNLKCHRVHDQLAVRGLVDLDALQPQFSDRGCRLGRAKLFCVPAARTLLLPPAVHPEIVGQSLADDYVCYALRCPIRPGDEEVGDALGTRPLRGFTTAMLCAPARKSTFRTPCGPGGLSCDRAREICVSRYLGGPGVAHACEPVPGGCEADRTCSCGAATLCSTPPADVCQDSGSNSIFCDCPPCV